MVDVTAGQGGAGASGKFPTLGEIGDILKRGDLALAFGVLTIAHKVLGMPMGVATGVMAGLCTQPATLVFADEQAGNELPELGYTTVFPAAMLTKILIAQILLGVL